MSVMMRSAAQIDSALQKFVAPDGSVDYRALAADQSVLACARELAEFDCDTLQSREAQLAFWINAYNCLVLCAVVERMQQNPSYRGVREGGWLGMLRFFYINRHSVCGRRVSLANIENSILRRDLQEPRIHFALVCASASCPPLKNGLYSAEHIDAELEMATRAFIRSPRGVRVEPETHTVWLSAIFKWYAADFDRAAGSVLQFIMPYLDDEARAYLDRHAPQVKLRYFKYDWTLNQRA